jgi:hypothetical protein
MVPEESAEVTGGSEATIKPTLGSQISSMMEQANNPGVSPTDLRDEKENGQGDNLKEGVEQEEGMSEGKRRMNERERGRIET